MQVRIETITVTIYAELDDGRKKLGGLIFHDEPTARRTLTEWLNALGCEYPPDRLLANIQRESSLVDLV